ncbi:MAG: hypothetical protein KDD85_13960 [Parvularculaceae bacterium]|nr:hypothetical protein [Parvularculaceae bacterium]
MRMGVYALAAGAAIMTGGAALAENGGDPRQGEEVGRICFGRDINNFKAIEGEDDAVLLERGVNDWYRASLTGACNYRQLKWAQSVIIEQRPAGGCLTRGDTLVFSRSISGDFSFPNTTRCIITDIHKWDRDAKADEDAPEDEEPSADE